MIADQQLSKNFSLYDLTATSHAEFKEMNREINPLQIAKLKQVAELWELVWELTGIPWVISSGYRCPALNQAVGSTIRSQHLLCEAADAVPKGIAVDEAFRKMRQLAKDGKFRFGQLIFEKATRGYSNSVVEWVHLSLGSPHRAPEHCGQILTMNEGQYQLLETIVTD